MNPLLHSYNSNQMYLHEHQIDESGTVTHYLTERNVSGSSHLDSLGNKVIRNILNVLSSYGNVGSKIKFNLKKVSSFCFFRDDGMITYERTRYDHIGSLEKADAGLGNKIAIFTDEIQKCMNNISFEPKNQAFPFGLVHESRHNENPKDKNTPYHLQVNDNNYTNVASCLQEV